MRKSQFHRIIFLVAFWVFAAIIYIFLEGAIESFAAVLYKMDNYRYDYGRILLHGILVAFFGASSIATFEVLYFNKILRKNPFGVTLLLKTAFYLFSIFCFTSIATIISYSYDISKPMLHSDVYDLYFKYLASPKLIMVMVYWSFAVLAGLFIIHVSDKFGHAVLLNLFLGKYHRPKEESRIFMFLDLTSATALAEKLGPYKYSSFLKDFFFDLDDAIYDTKGAVYQFVGDEVVIIWDIEKGVENNNCIRLFFLAQEKLRASKNKYNEKYGVCPEFKGGLHYGDIIIAEVGGRKREIAYHGDTVNTAARIRSVCHKYNKELLISADLVSLLVDIDEEYLLESMGVMNLEGKKNVIALFSVEVKDLKH